jgi:phage gpG-like protein
VRYRISISGVKEARADLLELSKKFKGSKKPVMERIAKRLRESILSNIDRAQVAPLSEATLRMRATRKGKPRNTSTQPLTDTGKMRGRVTTLVSEFTAQAWADTFYASFVQLGIRQTAGAIPGKRIPPRPFMVLSPADVDDATEWLLDYMLGDDRAAA